LFHAYISDEIVRNNSKEVAWTSGPRDDAGRRPATLPKVLYCTPLDSVILSPYFAAMGYRTAVLLYLAAGMGGASGDDFAPLQIRVLDYANVPKAVLHEFESPARHLFQGAGIDAEWRICRVFADDGACEPLRDEDTYVKIVGRSPGKSDAIIYGTTVQDGSVNCFAYVYWERVEATARRQGIPASLLLAHVVAHEVGHLLGLDHAASGIMRRQFGPPDLLRAVKGRLRFTDREGTRMREALRSLQLEIAARN
jgi:hypothetical protein